MLNWEYLDSEYIALNKKSNLESQNRFLESGYAEARNFKKTYGYPVVIPPAPDIVYLSLNPIVAIQPCEHISITFTV
jgi:hypothetical protein